MHHYRISGWTLSAEMPLPHLFPCSAPEAGAVADITVRKGPVQAPTLPLRLNRDGIQVGADGRTVIDIPDYVRIGLADGRDIMIDPGPGVSGPEIQTWLLGPGLGVICHQRGVVPLHACTIRTGNGGLAIVGNSGAGKSTTATALVQRGHRLLGDDVLVVDPDTGMAQPCFPMVKLWDSSRSALEIGQEGQQPVARRAGKWHVPMLAAFDPVPCPLSAIVHLRADPAAQRPVLTRWPRPHAAAVLDAMTYRAYLADALHGRRHVLSMAARLAARVPVWELVRTTDFKDLDEMLDMLEGLASP
ncbi:MAG: serine kinase [Niveispirillum sp.]|nr:serine kinase [Niveispirillum sp.]